MDKPHLKPNTYAFIDSQNLNISVQRMGWKMDWKKFRQFLADTYQVTSAYMFIGYMPEHEKLYEQMHQAGYKVVLKPTFDMTKPQPGQETKNPEDEKHVKGNIDADLVLWAMKEWPNYRQAIIVSGDGDFYSLVEHLAEQNKLKHILAPTGHYSGLYNKYDSFIVRLDKYRSELAYHDRRRSSPKTRNTSDRS